MNDKVEILGNIGYISGFTNGGAYIKDVYGNYITLPNKNYKQVTISRIKLIEHNNNWQYIAQKG